MSVTHESESGTGPNPTAVARDGLTSAGPPEQADALRFGATWAEGSLRIADARGAVRTLLARAGHPPGLRVNQDAQLVVSELITNALRHAPGPCGMLLDVAPGRNELHVTVSDTSRRLPVVRAVDAERMGGRGLHLVLSICGRLRVVRHAQGKRVTAVVPLP
ncbi:ATP-binding protein [Streptomyces cellostaticus]|uniref:ATP-binding protein n=1 Tax=Streptomyces cellostaticus TaxID=67285 RepID=UPI0020263BCC|nr:ATP-binding protein [Streptomyces cellostaticus]